MTTPDGKVDVGEITLTLHLGRFSNDESLQEIYRVLAPGGAFGMIWNIEDCQHTLVRDRDS